MTTPPDRRTKRPRAVLLSPATPGVTDRLSCLPVEMLEEILRRLPLEDAVRTSALAKPWRFRWAECPGLKLAFEDDDEDPPSAAAVDAFLAMYTCNVSDAQLVVEEESFGKVDGWLRALATRGIRYLFLCFNRVLYLRLPLLPASLYSCAGRLTKLRLKYCDIPELPPTFDSFPNLLELDLEYVNFGDNGERTFEALIAKSPLLTSLTILFATVSSDDQGNYMEWVIKAPNLKIFSISAWQDYGWRADDFPLIEDATVCLEGPDLPRILAGVTRVETLAVEIADDTILEGLSYFMNLNDLLINTPLTKASMVLSMLCILRSAPNLEDLHITILHEDAQEIIEVDMELLNAQGTVGLFSTLKSFHICGIMGHVNEMRFMEFLMSKATILQNIHISVHDDSYMSMEVICDELSRYKKASPQGEILIHRFVDYNSDQSDDSEEP